MKTTFLVIFTICTLALHAKTYYFSSSGSDNNTGTSLSSPFQTIAKLNSLTLNAGDNVLFNRGDIFYGIISLHNSGSAGSPITFSAYGTGNKPIITGFTTISSWTNLGANIWESSNTISSLSYTNMVVVNGINTPMGRYPNTGYFLYTNPTSNPYTVTCTSLSSSNANWTGAEFVAANTTYTILRDPITSHSGNVITFAHNSSDLDWESAPGYLIPECFIQNDPRTLDTTNEWYYNPSTKKIRIYSKSVPSNVQVSTIDTLVKVITYANNYITFDNINFTGSNKSSIEIQYCQNITIQNCDFNYSGVFGVHAGYGVNQNAIAVQNCTFNNSNNVAISLSSNCTNAVVNNNTVKNTGGIIGMIAPGGSTAIAIDAEGAGTSIGYNVIDSVGYNGIQLYGNNTSCYNNNIQNFCAMFTDGGGIYTYNGSSSATQSGVKIYSNIIINAIGQNAGIYLDEKTNNAEVYSNSIAYCQRNIYLHNNWSINVHNNTCFSGSKALVTSVNDYTSVITSGITFRNNIFFAKNASENVGYFETLNTAAMDAPFASDSNYWARPINDSLTFQTKFSNAYTNRTLTGWKTLNNQDAHSKKSPKAITDTNDLKFEYNATASAETISLDANYIDVTGKSFNGSITLNPYTSAVLIKNGAVINIPPKANAGQDQTITLPINYLTLSGSGTDSDGVIAAYSWTKVSGPSQDSIANPTAVTTKVTGLTKGVYLFALKVTDNNGATASDTMKVTVNPAPNQSPVANAGPDISINLPTNSLTLTGSGNDPDGTVINYLWTKIAGPNNYNIQNPSSAVTNISGLVQGVYQFQLQVMDNDSATGNDIVIVTVNPATNKAPVAFAGAAQNITLPLDSVLLSGSGSDSDGTVISYAWTKTSGPGSYNITNPSSTVTSVTGLVSGVYQFELDVTDNDGAIGKDVVQITVNAAQNIPPTANAGVDQVIILPVNSVSLSGIGSDKDGTVTNYLWTKISGPQNFIIANNTSASTDVTGLSQGVYQFQLSVTDNNGAIATDVIQVTVDSATNMPPVANAGSNQSINLPLNSVILSGSGSDSDGIIASYSWAILSGPSAINIISPSSPSTAVTGLIKGVYQFQLSVTDNDGATGTSIVQIIVNGAVNIPPTADAGVDQNITLPTNSVTLYGSGNDTDGVITNYTWTKISGPRIYTIESKNSAVTNISDLTKGTYQFQLKVTDNNGATATDIVKVMVNAALNVPPTANAGADQSITLPTNIVTLSGSGNDPDGTIVSYSWTKVSGPGNYDFDNSNAAETNVSGLTEGVYQFQLQVTDNKGSTGTAIIQISVNAAPNQPPVANAGADITITLPQDSVMLSGIGSDVDGTIVNYQWSEISGPSSSILNASSAVTAINGLSQGTYNLELEVTDNDGATTSDTMQVIVNAPVNIPPVANAGPDQTITLPQNSVTLNGSGTDQDGTIVGYSWSEIFGPSGYSIGNASSENTAVNNLVQGVYKFVLKVTDNSAGVGVDTVVITVNSPGNISPISNAGQDQTITLPINSVTLSGSGSDADGTIAGYEWLKISGPNNYNFQNSNAAITSVSGLTEGVYQFELQVTDNDGATATDVVQITVNAAPNQPPVASAGPDQTIALPVNTITTSGSGSDADGTIASYQWTKVSGPSSYNIINPVSGITNITSLVKGVYKFQLKVTDNEGASSTDLIIVIVNSAPNQPPVSNAGTDQSITLPVNSVMLTGSGTDADGNIVSYSWIKLSGPLSYNIVNATSANTDLTGLSEGIYQFQLKVTDNDGAIGTDNIQITVNAAPNKVPVANAGPDQSVNLPTNSVILSGSGNDSDGSITNYLWTKISGPASYLFSDSTSALVNVNNLAEGTYQFQLQVTDNDGAISTDIVEVTVNPAPNKAPTANAGTDQLITLPTNSVTLNGSGTDEDGTIVSYLWTKVSGPSGYTIANPSSATTLINNLVKGTYQFQLKVTDNDGATNTDIIKITVNAAPNQPPVANAGADQVITLPINSVTLTGSGTDQDGTVVSYLWTKISGPSVYTFGDASSPSTSVTGLVQGIYQFQLTVTDNDGATSTDVIQITVNAAPNQPPTANAGNDQTITLPQNNAQLNGYGTDEDGTIVSYTWIKISGPSGSTITNSSLATTPVTGLVKGVYQFELKVTDNSGATSTDIMEVIVNAAANQPPTANAGSDQSITLPVNYVTVSGIGTDVDGSIINYSWSKVSGPANFNIVNVSSATTNINGLTSGIYKFELKVTDNNGASGKDTIVITVNAAPNIPPTVNAGPDQSLILPVNSTTLAGSANDADGSITSYKWSKVSGPATYEIVNIGSPVTDIWDLQQGVYTFELTVTDNSRAVARDTVQITVVSANVPPIANAGADQTITLPQNSVTLNGNGEDSDGVITSYSWAQISGPSHAAIVSNDSSATLVDSLVGGNYQFELTITDNNGGIGKDTVTIAVAEPRLNVSPQADIVKAYPNPVTSLATLEVNTTQPDASLHIVITTTEGKIVYMQTIATGISTTTQQIDFTNFAKDVYIISVYNNKKLIKSIQVVKM